MTISSIDAISPIDGRYSNKTSILQQYFSEGALIKYRLKTEIEYFIALCELGIPQLENFPTKLFDTLRDYYINFENEYADRIKTIEKTTNHDVKSVEYFLREVFDTHNIEKYKEFIHFGLTSQDINNTAMPMMMHDAHVNVIKPQLDEIADKIRSLSEEWLDIPMLAHTHGQPASPTTVGKELYVFYERMTEQLEMLDNIDFYAKFGGATGNFNAHKVAFPMYDWRKFGDSFTENYLNLKRLRTTTQIDHYDMVAAYFHNLIRINNILLDLDRDMWTYISMDYFKQKIKQGEVGSSAMPHKVNPIDFENSEGNIGIANAIFDFLAQKLPVSRMQRDLTDSTVMRNIGVPIAHSLIAYKSLMKGLDKVIVNKDKIRDDLNNNVAVLAEAIQTILRRENYPDPYNALKELTRKNTKITLKGITEFIDNLDINEEIKQELRLLSPESYIGYASEIQ